MTEIETEEGAFRALWPFLSLSLSLSVFSSFLFFIILQIFAAVVEKATYTSLEFIQHLLVWLFTHPPQLDSAERERKREREGKRDRERERGGERERERVGERKHIPFSYKYDGAWEQTSHFPLNQRSRNVW